MNSSDHDNPIYIDVRAVHSLMAVESDFLLLDCRERAEHQTVRIDGATLIPMGELQQRAGELEEFRQKRIIVYCHHGGRSLMVTQWLREQGFARAQNMTGGIDAWALEIDTSLPRY